MSIETGPALDIEASESDPGRVGARADAQPTAPLSRAVTLLCALACGLAVANIYFAQPLLDEIAGRFAIDHALVGLVVTATQAGYGVGLLLVVPLGDLLPRRRLIVAQSVGSALALLAVGIAPNVPLLFAAMAAIGLLAVVTQVLVAYSATLAAPAQRGHVVGIVTSGIVIGILLARTVSGALSDLAGWHAVYFVSAGCTLIVALLLHRALPAADLARAATPYPRLIASVFTLFATEPVLRIRALISLLMFAAAMVLWTPMVLPLSAPPHSLSHTAVGLFGLAGAAGALGAARAGGWSDRGRERYVTGAGLTLMLASWLPIHWIGHSLWPLVIGVVAFDLGLQATHVASQSMLYGVLPPGVHSRVTAGYMIFYSIGCALGSFGSTLAYAWDGWRGVCALGASISALALLAWALTVTHTPRRWTTDGT
ncbi:MFS transporter [Burkholderia alba]|uniref:MFS transporter n=1 Tax=Burkholderia alba TaxID=2683677 RepID=UPI002B0519BD|nr:MFS transporter [Burkholderia alba]